MTRRRLRPDEIELWRRVADTTDRLHPDRKGNDAPMPRPKPQKQAAKARPVESFQIGQPKGTETRPHDLAAPLPDRIGTAPLRMDRKMHQRLKRGKLLPEARLDLHGMTTERAHPRLMSFILKAQGEGKRLVLVITGKGKNRDEGGPIPVRHGVLRHQVPHWLSVPPLAQAVLQVVEAHTSHGGGGAYYVYLRRHR